MLPFREQVRPERYNLFAAMNVASKERTFAAQAKDFDDTERHFGIALVEDPDPWAVSSIGYRRVRNFHSCRRT